jgi:hypothetical protein
MSLMLRLSLLDGRFAVARLDASAPLPAAPAAAALWSVTRTADELSLVCDEQQVPAGARAERGWRVFALQGPIPFEQTGVIAGLTAPLAAAEIPVFVLSTFDTDYLLVREVHVERARAVLAGIAGCQVR